MARQSPAAHRRVLHRPPGGAWLDRIHTGRLGHWADSHGPLRAALTRQITNQLITAVDIPDDAAQHLNPS
jgi:hypothetical protein